jgi:hypothetical protein
MPVIPVTQNKEIGRTEIQGQPREKVSEALSPPITWLQWCVSVISAARET